MSNPFDDKLKQSLEGFEMPYDAGAWAELAKQLPPEGTVVGSEVARFGWKGAAAIAVLVATVATVWYFNQYSEVVSEQVVVQEVLVPTEVVEVEITSVEPNTRSTKESKVRTEAATATTESNAETNVNSNKETPADVSSTIQPAEAKKPTEVIPVQPKETTAAKLPTSTPKDVKKPFVAKFLPSSVNVCVGEDVNFINQSSNTKAKMLWDFGDGFQSSDLNPSHSFVMQGNYQVRLTGTDADQKDDHTITVIVNPTPTTDLVPTEKLVGYKAIPFYHFETSLQPTEIATWKFSDGSTIQGAEVNHLFRDAGKAGVTLSVKNGYGCTATDSWNLDNNMFDIMAPTAFTPEGNGVNETFIPVALTFINVPFEMIIRDQKGQEVFRTSNAQEPWNGRLTNTGEKLAAGIYVWSVILKENICLRKDFNGPITIRR